MYFRGKKTLKKSDLADAFEHLASIRRKFAKHFQNKLCNDNFEPDITLARRAFSQITGKIAPENYQGIYELPKTEGILFHTLVHEQNAPVSIVHGYDGYKTEEGLRTAFINLIEERSKLSHHGLGIPSFPNLVTSNKFCLIKGDGNPYISIKDNNSWVAIFSTRHNPARIILEIIWSKISSHFGARMPYGSDLDIENAAPLLIAEPQENSGQFGWFYKSIEYKEKNLIRDELQAWQPQKVSSAEMSAINLMAGYGGYLKLDIEMDEYFKKNHNCTLHDVVSRLVNTRVFAQVDDYLRPVSSITHVITNNDMSGYIATERDRFDAWCEMNSIPARYFNILFLE